MKFFPVSIFKIKKNRNFVTFSFRDNFRHKVDNIKLKLFANSINDTGISQKTSLTSGDTLYHFADTFTITEVADLRKAD